jgi:hypothetical protein
VGFSTIHEWLNPFLALCNMNLRKTKKFRLVDDIVLHVCICLLVVHGVVLEFLFQMLAFIIATCFIFIVLIGSGKYVESSLISRNM